MQFPQRFSNLPEYTFSRLHNLLKDLPAGGPEVALSIGEPRHAFPDFVPEVMAENVGLFAKYPPNTGTPELLTAISAWIKQRYGVDKNPDTEIITLNGTREGLFNAAVALCPELKNGKKPNILIPNPFYPVYAAATLAVNAEPVFLPCYAANKFLPDFNAVDDEVLDQTAIVYLCSPSNPQGAVASKEYWTDLFRLAEKHDFLIFADECYSEIYRDAPPPGGLEVVDPIGADPERIVVFHSLSKRSNLPGLRSGFAAGGPKSIGKICQVRNYTGAPLSYPLQKVAEKVWADETHVIANRELYKQKFISADHIFAGVQGYISPEAGFFLWLPVDDGEAAVTKIWQETGVMVLPGAYLGRDVGGENPGQGYIRVAMVAEQQEMQRGLQAIRNCIY